MQWEARRVAAAFGLEAWGRDVWFMHSTATLFSGAQGEVEISWRINPQGTAIHLSVGSGDQNDCIVTLRETTWKVAAQRFQKDYAEVMARGLYCLGVEDEGVIAQLDSPLTAHEKLELRLSMPRELWPKTWLDEVTLGE